VDRNTNQEETMLNSTNTFDLTQYTITQDDEAGRDGLGRFTVQVTEGSLSLILVTDNGDDLMENAIWNVAGLDRWTADRIAYVFSLASRKIRQHLCTA